MFKSKLLRSYERMNVETCTAFQKKFFFHIHTYNSHFVQVISLLPILFIEKKATTTTKNNKQQTIISMRVLIFKLNVYILNTPLTVQMFNV